MIAPIRTPIGTPLDEAVPFEAAFGATVTGDPVGAVVCLGWEGDCVAEPVVGADVATGEDVTGASVGVPVTGSGVPVGEAVTATDGAAVGGAVGANVSPSTVGV